MSTIVDGPEDDLQLVEAGDVVSGGGGTDTFIFNALPTGPLPVITDFISDVDHLAFTPSFFDGTYNSNGYTVASAPTNPSETNNPRGAFGFFIYVTGGQNGGTLYWDPTGGNGADAVPVVKLSSAPELHGVDIHVNAVFDTVLWTKFTGSSGNALIDAMLLTREVLEASGPLRPEVTTGASAYKWGGALGTNATLTYSFFDPSSQLPNDYAGNITSPYAIVPDQVKAAYRFALDAWGNVANLHFVEVPDTSASFGTLRLGITDAPNSGLTLGAGSAGPSIPPDIYGYTNAGDTWTNSATVEAYGWSPGERGTYMMIHETGHSVIGMTDTSDLRGIAGLVLPRDLNYRLETVMSFASGPGTTVGDNLPGPNVEDIWPTTPMVLDIQTAQYVYGANMSYRAGDDTYHFSDADTYYETIWDAGGTDTFSIAGNQKDGFIDLRPGQYSDVGTVVHATDGNVTIPLTKTVGIAYGAIIENATGGSGNDTIIGNDADNLLSGGGGNDSIDGGSGVNTASYSGNMAQYSISTHSNGTISVADNVAGRDGTDTLKNSQLLHFADLTIAPLVNQKDTVAAAAEIFQLMSGKVVDEPSINNAIGVLSTITVGLTTAAAWDAMGASLADSSFAPQFSAELKSLDVDSFINKVTAMVFGSPKDSADLHNEYAIFKDYYAAAPDQTDPTGDVRARGSFVADMLHEASDIAFGQYYTVGQSFMSAFANGTAHFDASLF